MLLTTVTPDFTEKDVEEWHEKWPCDLEHLECTQSGNSSKCGVAQGTASHDYSPSFFLRILALFGAAVDNSISLPPLQLATSTEAFFLASRVQLGPAAGL